jgi:hypothetical protein
MNDTFKRIAREWMASFPEYDSDEEAMSDGLQFGDIYRTADNHISAPGGMLKTVMLPS